ncbi:1-deoxy-D-xylulose-5-phosphate reductoisomerase [Thiobacter aerophilum]|uniref:1-deoxy-D-xylulose 5-phosphate reductoisomerase n=1 Tax=Thiobacter aerophilum TaxID=3121275 RepID=A0ABV0EAU9_9BURK
MRRLTILGSTGSIGTSTLDVVARHPDRFQAFALTAQAQWQRLMEQCRRFRPVYAVLTDRQAAEALAQALREEDLPTQVLAGEAALAQVASAPEVDTVMAAIVGAAGLVPTLAAAQAGKRILLANKEALVMSGALFMEAVKANGAELLPIDSEHNAVFQCLPGDGRGLAARGVRRILLTASGGPFRTRAPESLEGVTPAEACAHPNWVMGRKISVDSATMMNKGLEVIEAYWLFDAQPEQIQVVIHPQSVIHSMVEYVDGSVLAQLSNPDMRTPIAHALGYPERIDSGVEALDLFRVARLTFEAPDPDRFPCLNLAYQALRAGGTAPAVLNAANEIAVEAFLAEALPFRRIPALIETVLARLPVQAADSLDTVLAADAQARALARRLLSQSEVT